MDTIKIEEIGLHGKDISISNMLQKYIPMILENDLYFKSFSAYIFSQYTFEVNIEHLRKKLNVYLKESFRDDVVVQAQRLIRGEYEPLDNDKITWIWVSSKDVGLMAQEAVERNDNILKIF